MVFYFYTLSLDGISATSISISSLGGSQTSEEVRFFSDY
jgi:hypothetical protein